MLSNTSREAARAPVGVVGRELLHAAPELVTVKVPVEAKEGSFPSDAGDNEYVQFAQHVKGGVVNFFVHGADPRRFCGETITARVEIWKKSLSDGRSFLYVDLQQAGGAPQCRVVAMSARPERLELPGDAKTFETIEPLVGCVVLAPLDAKIVVKTARAAPQQRTHAEAVKATAVAGDPQLSRYLADGWEIRGEDAREVELCKKNAKGEVKCLTHKKPTPAKKKR